MIRIPLLLLFSFALACNTSSVGDSSADAAIAVDSGNAGSADAASSVDSGVASDAGAALDAQGRMVADFSLPDVNESSTRFEQMVSPFDYSGQVSAWYFGHAT